MLLPNLSQSKASAASAQDSLGYGHGNQEVLSRDTNLTTPSVANNVCNHITTPSAPSLFKL